jgi:hypothetical protein
MHASDQSPGGGSTPQADPERRLWFDFLSKLNDRSIQEQRESGATGWVLLAAAVGILYTCVPLIPHFLSLPGALRAASVIFLLEVDGLAFFYAAYALALHYSKDIAGGRLQPHALSRFLQAFSLAVCFGALILAALHGWPVWRFNLQGFVKWVLVFFGLVWLGDFAVLIVRRWRKGSKAKRLRTTVPTFSGITIPRGEGKVTAVVSLAMSICAVCALLVYLRSLDRLPADWVTPLSAASHLLALVGVVAILLLRRAAREHRGAYLALERAIVVERLSADEIRARFEAEMLGPAVADWLKELGDGVRREHDNLKAALGSVRERAKEIRGIDPRYKLERMGRAKALSADWRKTVEGHLSKLQAFSFQVGEGSDFPLSPVEYKILSRVQAEWHELIRQAKEENNSTAAVLEELVRLIDTEGKDAP